MKQYKLIFAIFFLFNNIPNAQTTLLHCGKIIDIFSEKPILKSTIAVKDDKIIWIKKGYLKKTTDEQIIDLTDKTVLPGLMDMHTHLSGQSNPKKYLDRFTKNISDIAYESVEYSEKTLMSGFTTVREVGGPISISLRNSINKNLVIGPRIYAAGKSIATTGGHADPTNGMKFEIMGDPGPKEGVINGVDDARKAVRQRYKNGADLIKITATGGVLSVAKNSQNPQFTEKEIKTIVETANDYGMHVAAHAHGIEGMQRAIKAGVKSIEHGTLMDDETIALMKKFGTYYVPTISAGKFVAEKAREPNYYPDVIKPKALEIGPKIQNTFSKAFKAGVKIAFGTDSGVSYHGDNAKEFIYMVEAGMKPIDAIRSATINAAEMLGIDDQLGTIEPGKVADIIAVTGDPLKDISCLEKVDFVMKNGHVFKKE